MKSLEKTAKIIASLGAIILGLMTFNLDLIGKLGVGVISSIIYAVIGLSGILALLNILTQKNKWKEEKWQALRKHLHLY